MILRVELGGSFDLQFDLPKKLHEVSLAFFFLGLSKSKCWDDFVVGAKSWLLFATSRPLLGGAIQFTRYFGRASSHQLDFLLFFCLLDEVQVALLKDEINVRSQWW